MGTDVIDEHGIMQEPLVLAERIFVEPIERRNISTIIVGINNSGAIGMQVKPVIKIYPHFVARYSLAKRQTLNIGVFCLIYLAHTQPVAKYAHDLRRTGVAYGNRAILFRLYELYVGTLEWQLQKRSIGCIVKSIILIIT